MKVFTTMAVVLSLCIAGTAYATHVESYGHSDTSAASWAGGSLDGWSATGVFETPLDSGVPDEQFGTVEGQAVLYYAQPREPVDTYKVIPILAESDTAGSTTIIAVGSEHVPTAEGLNSFVPTWTGETEFHTGNFAGNTYHVGFGMTRIGVNNENGGIVPFNDVGGLGVIQQDDDTSDPAWTPAVGAAYTGGHNSAAGGRDYQYVQGVQWAVPEPASLSLIGLAVAFGVACLRRRK